MSFTVYKSSAGSGKTYTLVREYLERVLSNPTDFRHVLAITFTNKAANEMKERIINMLIGISEYEKSKNSKKFSPLLDELMIKTGLSKNQLIENSGKVLTSILHNYSDFAVSTIDSFIHRVIKSFAFDLNVPVNFDVEMDTDAVLKQVIDLLISRAGSEKDLTAFLVEFVRERADEEKNWNIESDLLKISRLLKKEDNTEFLVQNRHLGMEDYLRINAEIHKSVKRFESDLQKLGELGREIIASRGIPMSAFYYGNKGIAGYFSHLSNRNFSRVKPGAFTLKTVTEDKWFTSKTSKEDQIDILAVKPDLQEIYQRIQQYVENEYEDYIVLSEIRKALYPLAILDKINHILEEFKDENNILLIAEFNQLISDIVLEEPVPFIYERVGEKFKYFLVDEFQDTSLLQWQNLIPLIDNSLAQGNSNLLVGDAKQAIYRWRNGEVEQFVALPELYNRKPGQIHVERELALRQHYEPRVLNFNYRSRPQIVQFNNNLFSFAGNYLAEQDKAIYEGAMQEVASKKTGGYIQLEFFSKNDQGPTFKDFNCSRIKGIITEVCKQGYELEDIAILCRNNSEAAIIASFLLENSIKVVSSESVLLANSLKVRLITSVLRLLINPGNQLAAIEMKYLLVKMAMIPEDLHMAAGHFNNDDGILSGKEESPFQFLLKKGYDIHRTHLQSLPLYDVCEALIRTFGFNAGNQPFIQFFLDVVVEQERKIESDLHKFLEYWEKKKNSLSIVVPEGINAVKIMTIHKAKGLEFEIVIYPMVNESLRKTFDSIWINPDNEKVPDLKAALVGTNKDVEESKFGKKVLREKQKSMLDLVNLMYVAFTRPTDQLYVIATMPSQSRNATLSVSSVLINYLKSQDVFEEEKEMYSFGELTTRDESVRKTMEPYSMDKFISENWRSRALVSYQAPLNWQVDAPEEKQEWGNLIHEILSKIKTTSDLKTVLEDYVHHGILSRKEANALKGIISEFLARTTVLPYFKEGLSVKTESEIITPSGNSMRPDRIVQEGDIMYVIDFKTGVPSEKHKVQMQDYLNVMNRMDFAQTKGVILYLNQEIPVYVS